MHNVAVFLIFLFAFAVRAVIVDRFLAATHAFRVLLDLGLDESGAAVLHLVVQCHGYRRKRQHSTIRRSCLSGREQDVDVEHLLESLHICAISKVFGCDCITVTYSALHTIDRVRLTAEGEVDQLLQQGIALLPKGISVTGIV